MLHTTKQLINEATITNILKDIVAHSYDEIKEEDVLLCLECCDVDLSIATSNHFEFQEAIKENFVLDKFGEIEDQDEYRRLMCELHDFFIELHKESGLFDFFPEGEYQVSGENRFSDSDIIAPKGRFFAPFEDAMKKKS
nr:hypothetical protein [uncultured Bacillus sp.]